VVLTKHSNVYRGIDLQTSRPTVELATEELHNVMRKAR
jgi:hypothetical protein